MNMRKFRIFQNKGYFSIDLEKHKLEAFRIIDANEIDVEKDKITSTNLLGELPVLGDKKIIYETPEIPKVNAMVEEQQSFFDSITLGNEISCSLYDGLKALEIAEIINNTIMEQVRKEEL